MKKVVNEKLLEKTGIKAVDYYTAAGPVETCDRCSQGIRHVAKVTYKDGIVIKVGMDCIRTILRTAPNLGKLFNKNAKLLQKYNVNLEILSRAPEDMPRGGEYFDSGLYFVGDGSGNDIFGAGCWFFHPIPDWDKNQSGHAYVQKISREEYRTKYMADINSSRGKQFFQFEIARIQGFLARILNKVTIEQTQGKKYAIDHPAVSDR